MPFRGKPPSRRIAMAWRKSSAIARFLHELAVVVKGLPQDLLHALPRPATAAGTRAKPRSQGPGEGAARD